VQISILLFQLAASAEIAARIRMNFPEAEIGEATGGARSISFSFDVAFARADSAVALREVATLARVRPGARIVGVAERDVSAGSYLAGASDFVQASDWDGMIRILRDVGLAAPGEPSSPAPAALRAPAGAAPPAISGLSGNAW
jgi:hypothetical protein